MTPSQSADFFLQVYRDLRAYEGARPCLLLDDLRDAWLQTGLPFEHFDDSVLWLARLEMANWQRVDGRTVVELSPQGVERTLYLLDPGRRARSMLNQAARWWQRWMAPGAEMHAA